MIKKNQKKMENKSRNGIVNALIYLMVFVLVQLITTYVVYIIWGLAEGKTVSQSLAAIGREPLPFLS